MKRKTMLDAALNTPYWDVIIIGGGASGLWCAYDASLRGYRTLLVEKDDFASATSSKSTKLIHGGLRYLKQGHLSLVREALLERYYLRKNAPDFIKPLPFILPYYKGIDRFLYGFGMGIYDFFASPIADEHHRSLSPNEVLEKCPTLKANALKGGCYFYDGQFDDSRFAIELVKMASLHEAVLLHYMPLTKFLKQGGKIVGVEVKDHFTNAVYEMFGKVIINATGIFTDEIRTLDTPHTNPIMTFSRGSHIVLDQEFLPGNTAVVFPKTKDHRIAFCIPWHGKILVGTTDVYTDKPLQEPHATKEEITFLLEAAAQYLTKKPEVSDIKSVFAGIRPLVRNSDAPTAKLSRFHKILISNSGLITLTGGKWTTGRKMAEDTLNYAIELGLLENITCKTAQMPFEEPPPSHTGKKLHPDLPYTEEDIRIAIEHEMAMTLVDLLARRTRSLFLDVQATLEIAPTVARILQKSLSETDAFYEEQVKTFKTFARPYLP